ncbi:MAG: YkgJ family cysteine cluster protein [Kosmotogaceae bacterium]
MEKLLSIKGLQELNKIYSDLDREIETVKKNTGLKCLKNCRACCETPIENIEVSIFELLPLAIELWKIKKSEEILKKIEDNDSKRNCVLYINDQSILTEGGCSFYSFRPLICRLFGFSAVINRNGDRELTVCKVIKDSRNELIQEIRHKIKDKEDLPVYSEYTQKLMGINPYLGQNRFPINLAIKKAVELVGFKLMLLEKIDNNPLKPQYSE